MEEIKIAFSTSFSGTTKAVVSLLTGTGQVDHRETGAAVTNHPKQTCTTCYYHSREVSALQNTNVLIQTHRVVHSLRQLLSV